MKATLEIEMDLTQHGSFQHDDPEVIKAIMLQVLRDSMTPEHIRLSDYHFEMGDHRSGHLKQIRDSRTR